MDRPPLVQGASLPARERRSRPAAHSQRIGAVAAYGGLLAIARRSRHRELLALSPAVPGGVGVRGALPMWHSPHVRQKALSPG